MLGFRCPNTKMRFVRADQLGPNRIAALYLDAGVIFHSKCHILRSLPILRFVDGLIGIYASVIDQNLRNALGHVRSSTLCRARLPMRLSLAGSTTCTLSHT